MVALRLPGSVTNLQVDIDGDNITVQWDAPSINGDNVTSYTDIGGGTGGHMPPQNLGSTNAHTPQPVCDIIYYIYSRRQCTLQRKNREGL